MIDTVEMDRVPRYAPTRVLVFSGKGGQMAVMPVVQYVAHPPGTHPNSGIRAELTALEMVTIGGSRWYGFERVWINSELRMVVQGFGAGDEVRAKWEKCLTK